MGVEGLWEIMVWTMTSASSPKMSSSEAEGVGDAGSGVSGGGVPQGLKSGERGGDSGLDS